MSTRTRPTSSCGSSTPRKSTSAIWKRSARTRTPLRVTSPCRPRSTAARLPRLRSRRPPIEKSRRDLSRRLSNLEAVAAPLWTGQSNHRRGPGLDVGRIGDVSQGLHDRQLDDVAAVGHVIGLAAAERAAVPGQGEEAGGGGVVAHVALREGAVPGLAAVGVEDLHPDLAGLVLQV